MNIFPDDSRRRNIVGCIFLALVVVIILMVIFKKPYKETINLSQKQIVECSRNAATGDQSSAVRLWKHYLIVKSDPKNGFIWMEVAAFNGDKTSQDWLSGEIQMVGLDGYRKIIGRTNEIAEGRISRWCTEKDGKAKR